MILPTRPTALLNQANRHHRGGSSWGKLAQIAAIILKQKVRNTNSEEVV